METIIQLVEVVSAPKSPNLWGALGCALAYSAALFATVDSFADMLLARGDGPDGRLSPALRLKSGSKLAAAGITVLSAATVLGLDSNWFALGALSVIFLVLVGLGALVLVRHRQVTLRSAVGAVPLAPSDAARLTGGDRPPLVGG